MELKVMRLPHAADLPLPEHQTEHAAGLDLLAAVPADAPIVIESHAYAMIPTGLCIALPPGTEGQVRPRSGLAAKHGVTVLNSPGTVDADYRGEIKIILINHGSESFVVTRGMRVAQLVVANFVETHVKIVETLSETARGAGGFGSTGVKHEANQRKG
jgi:dUTP pyrophosphatase